jgi:hypothetical protein
VVSDDGARVKREQPFTESDLEELQVNKNSVYINGTTLLILKYSLVIKPLLDCQIRNTFSVL